MNKTREERLFGAACLRSKLQQSGSNPNENEIYCGVLKDLALLDSEVVIYLDANGEKVEAALLRKTTLKGSSNS